MKHNEQMHKDIREVLEKLPEGILLINPKTEDILLSNTEIRRLFKCPDGKSLKEVKENLRLQKMQRYNL